MYAIDNNELYHHGIKGQKWGVRRFQNPDGSVTAKGAKRYYDGDKSATSSIMSKQKLKKPRFVNDRLTPNIDSQKYIKGGTTPIGNKLRKGAGVVKNKISDKHAERKQIKENYKNIKKEKMTTGQKLLWGKGTFKKAAKMMEKENMTMKDAIKYSKRRQAGKAALGAALLVGGAMVLSKADLSLEGMVTRAGNFAERAGDRYVSAVEKRMGF